MGNYSGIIALVIYLICLVIFIRYEAKHEDDEVQEVVEETKVENVSSPLDLNDEDATVACLIAAIECRNEFKKNVQVVNVRKVG